MMDAHDDTELERLGDAAVEIVESIAALENLGSNLVAEIFSGRDFIEFEHYPPDDVYDPQSHAQYYFHAHPPERGPWNDYGHFHTFLRPRGMPDNVQPADAQEFPQPDSNAGLCHLIGISMNRAGRPIRLFTTNRWVTNETWYAADDVIAMLDNFAIDLAGPLHPLGRWLSAMLVLFREDIAALIRERDAAVASWRVAHPGDDVFENRNLEVTSARPLNLEQRLAELRMRLGVD